MSGYVDIVVMRHPEPGAVKVKSSVVFQLVEVFKLFHPADPLSFHNISVAPKLLKMQKKNDYIL